MQIAESSSGNYFIFRASLVESNFYDDANVIFIIDNTGYTFIDAYLAVGETFEEICRAGRWRRVPKGWWFQGPRAKRRRVTVQRAPPTRSRVCARVAKQVPRLSSLCKEAIQITPRLPRAPSQARINATKLRIDPRDQPLRSSKHRPRISSFFKFFPETFALK